jgi:large subunit GTPase 1
MGRKAKITLGPGQLLMKQRTSAAIQQKEERRGKRESKPLESQIDVRDLDEVMEQAELAGRVFSALNPLPQLLVTPERDANNLKGKTEERKAEEALHQSSLVIPRRPEWHASMSAQELDLQERQSFLIWRRGLAKCVTISCFNFEIHLSFLGCNDIVS